jgi:hypothetical protein
MNSRESFIMLFSCFFLKSFTQAVKGVTVAGSDFWAPLLCKQLLNFLGCYYYLELSP